MKFSIKDFFSKFYHSRRKLQIWSHLLKKSLMESFLFFSLFSMRRDLEFVTVILGKDFKNVTDWSIKISWY